jgi:hypothetical protein
LSEANLNKHFWAKPACYEYARQIFHSVVKESALVEGKMRSHGTDITTYPSAHQEIEQPLPTRLEDKDLGDVNFPMTDYTDNLGDYEDDGFYNPELDDMDFPGYTTTYTKEQKFEIILY